MMAKKATTKSAPTAEETSRKEMEAKREEVTTYYKESITHLKVQLEYEALLKDIEVTRAERVQSQMFMSQMMAGPEKEQVVQQAPQPKAQGAGSDWDASMNAAPPRRALKTVED